ncbi:MAG TPA: glutaredoxin family protein [Actinomycetota bacterium]|jgi:glutaredoxin|nr:glutaredoxin family protein [Actinomycetota bacterium]
MSDVVLYTKPGCCLCDDAKAALERAGIGFREVDINRDPGLFAEYGIRIPVVEVGGVPAFEAGMNPDEIAELVDEARGL